MVVFTCNHCGESLQKPRVEKHYNVVCRNQKFLTCVDCFKDFRGDEYNVHTKCVSEEKRYSGKDFVEKTKKGEVKQESWMEMIKSIIMHTSNLKPQHKNLLETISNYDNVPRKRVKFINFIKSSTGGRTNNNDIEVVWDIIEKHKSRNASNQNDDNDGEKQIVEDENQSIDVSETSGKKKKHDESVAENGNDDINAESNVGDVNGKSKKKKKKRDESVIENGDTNNVTSKKKKNKLDVSSVENNNDSENGGIKLNGNQEIEPENSIADTTETSPKKKKKSAKAGLTNLAEPGLETELPLIENGVKSKKNKKHKIDDEVIANNIEVADEIPEKKKKSLTLEQTNEIVENVTNGDQNSFSFEEQINQILMKKQTIKKEKLYKKIFNKYLKITGEAISDDKIQKKINKKLKKCDNICVEGDFVKIIS